MQENGVNKVIFIAGGILLSIILGVGGLVGDFGFQGARYDASSKEYVEANLPPIIATWSQSALVQRASPQFAQRIEANRSEFDQLFHRLKSLGSFQSLGWVEGQSNVSLATLHGKPITAHYVANAIFTRGTARIKVRLIRMSSGWRLRQFTVYPRMLQRR